MKWWIIYCTILICNLNPHMIVELWNYNLKTLLLLEISIFFFNFLKWNHTGILILLLNFFYQWCVPYIPIIPDLISLFYLAGPAEFRYRNLPRGMLRISAREGRVKAQKKWGLKFGFSISSGNPHVNHLAFHIWTPKSS